MTNVATLKPNDKGERRGGRKPGVDNLFTRAMRTATMLAAETSKHSNGSLVAYLRYLADEKPELFSPMLCKLIPTKITADINQGPPRRLDASMSIDEMVTTFAEKIRNPNYRPAPLIEHDDDEASDE